MLHQPAEHFEPSSKPTVFDAEAYVRDMRAAGVVVNEMSDGFGLTPAGHGFTSAYCAAQERWHGLIDERAESAVGAFLFDERHSTAAAALIGSDIQKGLEEVRRLDREAKAAYAVERSVDEEVRRDCGPEFDEDALQARYEGADYQRANKAADEAGGAFHHALLHVERLPIQSVEDVVSKAHLVLEQRDYASDEDLAGEVLKQIVTFGMSRRGDEQLINYTNVVRLAVKANNDLWTQRSKMEDAEQMMRQEGVTPTPDFKREMKAINRKTSAHDRKMGKHLFALAEMQATTAEGLAAKCRVTAEFHEFGIMSDPDFALKSSIHRDVEALAVLRETVHFQQAAE